MYGSASSSVPTSRGLVAHVVYSALMVTYSWPRSEKKTSVSWPSPGSPTTYSTSSRATACASALASKRDRAAARAHLHALDRDVDGQRRGAGQRHADGLHDAPPVGVAAVQRGLDQRRVGDRARGAPRRSSPWPPRTTTRPMRLAPSPSRTMSSASWRSSASSAWPKRSSSSDSGSTAHAAGARAHEDRRVVGRELAVDGDAVERALHAHAEQQVGGLGRQRGVGLHEAQHRREGRLRSCPRPWPARSGARSRRQLDLEARALLERVGGHDRRGEVGVAVGAQLGAGARRGRRRPRACRAATPMTPVEATATWSACTPAGHRRRALHLGRVVHARARRWRRWRCPSWPPRRAARPGASARG